MPITTSRLSNSLTLPKRFDSSVSFVVVTRRAGSRLLTDCGARGFLSLSNCPADIRYDRTRDYLSNPSTNANAGTLVVYRNVSLQVRSYINLNQSVVRNLVEHPHTVTSPRGFSSPQAGPKSRNSYIMIIDVLMWAVSF